MSTPMPDDTPPFPGSRLSARSCGDAGGRRKDGEAINELQDRHNRQISQASEPIQLRGR